MMNKLTPENHKDSENQENSLESQVNEALDHSIDNLSPDIRRHLNQARIKASEPKANKTLFWKSASAFSLAFALVIIWQSQTPQNESTETLFAEVLQEDLEMLDELEFVYWMSEEEPSATL